MGDDKPTRQERITAAVRSWWASWRHKHRWQLRSVYVAMSAWPAAVIGRAAVLLETEAYVWGVTIVLTLLAVAVGVKIKDKAILKSKRDRIASAAGITAANAWITAMSYLMYDLFRPLAFLWLIASVIGCALWIWDHRVRDKVQLQAKADAVPETVEFAGYKGLGLLLVENIFGDDGRRNGTSYYMECPRHMLRDGVKKKNLEAAFPGLAPGALSKVDDPDNVRRFWIKVVDVNPWKNKSTGASVPVPHPAVVNLDKLKQFQARIEAGEAGVVIPEELAPWMPGSSVRIPRPIGDRDDGHPVTIVVWDSVHGAHRILLGGFTGSGKTVTENDIIAALAPCTDTVLWGIDVAKGGKVFAHWGKVFDEVATTPERAVQMMEAAQQVITGRGLDNAAQRRQADKVIPTNGEQQLIIFVEEGSALFGKKNGYSKDATEAAEGIAEGGRELAVSLAIITQRGDLSSLGNSGRFRNQLDTCICLKMKDAAEGRFILPDYNQVDVAALNQAGTFYMQTTDHGLDPRKARSYALATDEKIGYRDIEALADFYGPYRRRLNPEAARHITNGFYDGSAPATTPKGTPMTTTNPAAPTGLFDKPGTPAPVPAPRPGSRAELDALALQLSTDIREAGAAIEAGLTQPAPPRDLSVGDLTGSSGQPRDQVDLTDVTTKAVLAELTQRREDLAAGRRADAGASNAELIRTTAHRTGKETSAPTVLRRCNALDRAGYVERQGAGRSTTWYLKENAAVPV
jgi:hypothetical protein